MMHFSSEILKIYHELYIKNLNNQNENFLIFISCIIRTIEYKNAPNLLGYFKYLNSCNKSNR